MDYHVVASDAYILPFEDNFFDILYERLGALYHAADEDRMGRANSLKTEQLLSEYKRVLVPGGKIILDWINSRLPISTANAIEEASQQDIEDFFKQNGFDVEFFGDREGFVVLINSDQKRQ